MRSYLVDTQVLIWLSRDPKQLGRDAARILREAPRVFYSAISFGELEIKQAIGKFTVRDDFRAALANAGLSELPFTSDDAAQLGRFPALARHDPFDRFIMAQASARNMVLITADRVLLNLGLPWVVDARV